MLNLAHELYGIGWLDVLDEGLSPELHRLTHRGATRSEWLSYRREMDRADWLTSIWIGYSLL